jgi:hypothetical protein
MALQFVTSQIKNDAVTADKVKLDGGSYAFTSGATLQWAKDPSAANDLVRKSYVDAVASGLHWKDSVKAASTANLTLSGTQTVDGVALSADDRILVKDQTSGAENGIYAVKAGAWSRTDDMDEASEFPGAALFVRGGTVNADSGWVCTNDTNPTVGTTAITFAQFSGAGSIVAGNGLAKSGNTLSVNVDDSSLEINADALRVKASGITNAMLGGSIANAKLANSSIAIGGVTLALGATDATPAFNLSDATNYPTSSLSGTITNAQLAGSISNDKLAGSIANDKLANSSVSFGGVSLALGASDATPAFNLADATGYPTSSLTGTITNAQLAGSIANGKLSNSAVTIGSTAVSLGASSTTLAGMTGIDFTDASATIGASMATASVNLTLGGGCDTIVTGDLQVNGNTIADNDGTACITFDSSGNSAVTGNLQVTGNNIASSTGAAAITLNGANATINGDLTIAGNDLSMATNTAGHFLVADGSAYGPVAMSGDATMASTGAVTIASDAVEPGMVSFAPRYDEFSGDGTATVFNLTTRILKAGWRVAVVARNGQLLTQVSSGADDIDEYQIADNGSATQVTFGSAPESGDVLYVQYWA